MSVGSPDQKARAKFGFVFIDRHSPGERRGNEDAEEQDEEAGNVAVEKLKENRNLGYCSFVCCNSPR